jgi:Short-chain dehydrogenases of various substrate specificities
MQGKVVLVTGASSGLGLAAADGFARLGATVWLVVRSPERGEQARARIVERSGNGDVHVGVATSASSRQSGSSLDAFEITLRAWMCWSTTPG